MTGKEKAYAFRQALDEGKIVDDGLDGEDQ